jgi:hypothetical protein
LPAYFRHAARLLLFLRAFMSNTIDQATFKQLLPLAYKWAQAQEEFVLKHGAPLGPREMADAKQAGVQDRARVRVLVIDRIPLPDDGALAEAATRTDVLSGATRGVAIGHAVMIRADSWGNRELLVHNLVHVAQCERSGGLEQWVRQYLGDRHTCADFTIGSLEDEARNLARQICAL